MSVQDRGRWINRGGHMEYIHDDDDDWVRLPPPPPADSPYPREPRCRAVPPAAQAPAHPAPARPARDPSAPDPSAPDLSAPGYVADDYEPVARRRNTAGGWTAARQRAFLAALAQTGSVVQAAEAAGISARSAYRLRAHPDGERFAAAWAAAVMSATRSLLAVAFDRATDGAPRRVWRGGRIVPDRAAPSDRMLTFLLGNLVPQLFGRGASHLAVRRGQAVDAFATTLADTLDALVDVDLEVEAYAEAEAA